MLRKGQVQSDRKIPLIFTSHIKYSKAVGQKTEVSESRGQTTSKQISNQH